MAKTKEEKLKEIEEALAKIRAQVPDIQTGIEELTAPTDTGGGLVIEDLPGETPDITGAKATFEGWLAEQAAKKEEQAKLLGIEQEEAKKKAKEEEKAWYQKLLAKPTITEKRAEEFEKIGIKPAEYIEARDRDIAEIGSLMASFDTRKAQMDTALVGVEERLAGYPGGIMRGEKALLQKQQNIELSQMSAQINTKLAIMEMKKGNLEQALSFVREAVSDYVFDLKLEYEQFGAFKEMNADAIAELDEEYKTALDKAEGYALAAWNEKADTLNYVLDLQLKAPGAGITTEDTKEEATKKAEKWQLEQPEEGTATKALYDEAVKAGYTKDYVTFLQERGILETKDLVTPGLEGIDLNTTGGAQAVYAKFGDFGSTFAYYDDNTKLTTAAISLLLNDAGIFSATDKSGALADLMAQIDDYKINWVAEGDEGAGTREEFIKKVVQFYPEFTEQEIYNYVFKEVTHEWLSSKRPATGDEGGFWDFLPWR